MSSMLYDFSIPSVPSTSTSSETPAWAGPEGNNQLTRRPSDRMEELPRRSHSEDGGDGNDEGEDTHDQGRKRKRHQKFTRSRTACLQCRSRKSKCGALPPDPCPNCVEANLQCQWPAQDGRSSRARLARTKGGKSASGDAAEDVKRERELEELPTAVDHGDAWLNQLLRGGASAHSEGDPYKRMSLPDTSRGSYGVGPSQPARVPSSSFSIPTIPSVPQPSYPDMAPMQPPPHNPFDATFPQTPSFPSTLDPAQFIWAVSSRLPTVEDGSPYDQNSSHTNPSPSTFDVNHKQEKSKKSSEGRMVKVTWWRPHGQTAIAPGLKRITLKVRVDRPQDALKNFSPRPPITGPNDAPLEVIAPDGAPSTSIMKHLLDVFLIHFGGQYPALDRETLEKKIESRTGSTFLLLSIAAIAARFSTHPAVALPDMPAYDYGNVFYSRAKALLGSMLAVPSRETVEAFILLASCGFANDSESEVWMMTGLAVRMSIDLGLHLNPPEDSDVSSEDRRLNRLVFWSVLLMDYALAFGVGRSTTYRGKEITQPYPTQEDIDPTWSTSSAQDDRARSPFPYCAQMMMKYGPLINMLNADNQAGLEGEITSARSVAIKEYNQLPPDMQWNVTNLQRQSKANQASAFLHLHLWMHTILASGFLTGSNIPRRVNGVTSAWPSDPTSKVMSGAITPNSTIASNIWRNSARTIGDILVFSDIINPLAYCALPFVNQAFFVAGCCYVKEIEQTRSNVNTPINSPRLRPQGLTMTALHPDKTDKDKADVAAQGGAHDSDSRGDRALEDKDGARASSDHGESSQSGHGAQANTTSNGNGNNKQVDLSRALLTSVATTNLTTLQQGLEKQNKYWAGTAWISSALKQRIEGIGMEEIDLVNVTEKLKSFVSLPDAGLVGKSSTNLGGDETSGVRTPINGATPGNMSGMAALAAHGLFGTPLTGGPDGMNFLDLNLPGMTPTGNTPAYNPSDLDFLNMPFDLGVEGGSQYVTEQEIPLPSSFDPQWFR